MQQSLIDWNKKRDRLEKLQHFYLFVMITSLFGGALVNFYHQQLANNILIVTKFSALVFTANFIINNLFEAFILSKLNNIRPTTKK